MSHIKQILHKSQVKVYLQVGKYDTAVSVCHWSGTLLLSASSHRGPLVSKWALGTPLVQALVPSTQLEWKR